MNGVMEVKYVLNNNRVKPISFQENYLFGLFS